MRSQLESTGKSGSLACTVALAILLIHFIGLKTGYCYACDWLAVRAILDSNNLQLVEVENVTGLRDNRINRGIYFLEAIIGNQAMTGKVAITK